MRHLKLYLFAALGIFILCGATVGTFMYSASSNSPPKMWATDDTSWKTVAASSKDPGPTREQPVYIKVQVERLYGLHIGTPIKVRYIIISQNSVKIRFDTLMRGVLSRYTTTWRLYQKPTLISEERQGGFTMRIIEVVVAVWEPPVLPDPTPSDVAKPVAPSPGVDGGGDVQAKADAAAAANAPPPQAELWPFSVEFLYSDDKMANGLPKWTYIETPQIKFGFASLVEPGAKEFDFGPMGDAADTNNRLGVALIGTGGVIALSGLAYLVALFAGWLRRRRLPAELPVEITRYRSAIAEADLIRNRRSHFEEKRVAVRDFLGGASKPDETLLTLWQGDPDHERVEKVLDMLTDAVTPGRLSGYEERQLDEAMEHLIDSRLAKDARPSWLKRFGSSAGRFGSCVVVNFKRVQRRLRRKMIKRRN